MVVSAFAESLEEERREEIADAPRLRVEPQSPSPTMVSYSVMIDSDEMMDLQAAVSALMKFGRFTG